MNLESSLLRYFREVYRLKSIRQASANLNVAPSAVSRQILRLEQMVGVQLFERLPRGVAPTEAAEVLARFSRNFLLDVERVRGELESLRGLQRGHVRIMSTEGLVAYLLNRTIASFHRQFPGITYELAIAGTDVVAQCLHDGSADIGLVFNAEPDPQLGFAAQIPDPLCAVVAPDHRLAGVTKLELSDVIGFGVGVPEKSFGIRRIIDAAFSARKLQLTPALVTNSIEAMKGFARYGGGLTFLPCLPIRRELDTKVLVSIPVVETTFQQSTHDICILSGRRLPLAVEAFVEELKVVALAFPTDRSE